MNCFPPLALGMSLKILPPNFSLMIIRNRNVFHPSYVPLELVGRENEINSIRYAINSFLRGVKTHVYCFGLQGTGKTAVAKFLHRELNKKGIPSLYIDAKEKPSLLMLLKEIARASGFFIPERGISFGEFLERAKGRIKKLVIFLDEVDSFKDKDSLYNLAKNEELEIMFVFISNVPIVMFFSKLVGFALSLEFRRYSPKEIKRILFDRAKLGLSPLSYDEEVIGKIAGFAAKHKANARAGIVLLFHSANIAESKEHKKILIEDVEEAKRLLLSSLVDEDLGRLPKNKREILELLLNSQYLTEEEIAKKLSKGKRTVGLYLKELIKEGYVRCEVIKVGNRVVKAYMIKLKV